MPQFEPHIAIHNLVHEYADAFGARKVVLEIGDLTIRRGEFFCIVGPSGSGKSTLLNILTGFSKRTSGSVSIDGRAVGAPNPKYVQVDQEFGLFPWRTVAGNVEFGLELQRVSRHSRKEVVTHILDLVGLAEFGRHYPHQLSGGMKQRVALARTLAVDPDILFLDEPFGSLDALTRIRLQMELGKICRAAGKTVVFVTHSVEEAVFLGDRVAVFTTNPGRVDVVVDVPVPRPRRRLDPELLSIQRTLFERLGVLE